MKKATRDIKDTFSEFETTVLNISDYDLDKDGECITHAVLDGDNILLYSANPDLGDNFQDEDYEQIFLDDDDELWEEIFDILEDF